jgi:PBP1b-binding outer membrane lipoprotein LpoB
MKIKNIIGIGLAAALFSGCAWGHCEKCEKHNEADLMAQAKVTKDAAQATALAKVPNGTIKEGELEKEHGKLQWSFDVATPDSKDITEVNVDAITGEIISADKESASDEAKEADEEKQKKDDKD